MNFKRIFLLKRIAVFTLLFLVLRATAQTNLYVAADGSAPFKTVQKAIMAVPSGSRENSVIIHIAPGTYYELFYLQREKCFFKLVGEQAQTNTIITFDLCIRHHQYRRPQPIGTFRDAFDDD